MRYWLLAAAALGLVWPQLPSLGQTISPAPVDVAAVTAQAQQAQQQAAQAASAAQAAQTAASAAVRFVGGSAPDTSGNVALPNSFVAATCANCIMTGTTLSGLTMLNGVGVATLTDVANEASARNSAIGSALAGIPSSVNGQIGAVTIPVYTDPMAVAANAAAIASATNLAKAAASDAIQISAPASGGTVQAAAGTNVLFINNAALLASLTVGFPPSPVDGQRFTVAANNTITTLGFTGATSRGALNTLSASGYARFVWSASLGLWFRVG